MVTGKSQPYLPTCPQNSAAPAAAESRLPAYSLLDLSLYALKLGTIGFGGPVALVGYMNRDLVEDRKWVTPEEYKEGLTLAQLAPGPLAAQLAIFLGFVHHRVLGATVVGIAFVLPSFLMVVALGWTYRYYGGLPWMQSVFYGVGAAVIGIIAHSAYKLTRKTIGRDWVLGAIYLTAAALTVILESESVWLFLSGGVLVWLLKAPPGWLGRTSTMVSVQWPCDLLVAALPAADYGVLSQIFLFFTKAGAFVFGSGLAIVPFLYGGVVKEHHWLSEAQFLDAVAVAMITPGPVVITVGFIGYLVAGLPGAVVAAAGTFLPCYLFTIIPAPYFQRFGHRTDVKAFVDGVTATAIGAITGAVIVLGRRTLLPAHKMDWFKLSLALVTIVLLWRNKKIPEPLIIAAAAILGLLVYPHMRH